MKHLFIINPVAGKGKSLQHIPEIHRIMDGLGADYHIEITQYAGHGTEITKRYVKKEKYRVYSVGGDGTLNEVLNGLVGSDSSLAVIPCGSGNDFFRSIHPGGDHEGIILKMVNGEEKEIDLGKVNKRYFLNISSIGFDAETVYNAQRIKKLPLVTGSMAYVLGVLITVIRNKTYGVMIKYDHKEMTGKILLSAIANGRFYGGGMMPAPEAELEDGLFDLCMVRTAGRFRILKLLPLYMKGKHQKLKEVSLTKAKRIQIRSNKDFPLNIDGEVILVERANFEIIPKGIKVVMPKGD